MPTITIICPRCGFTKDTPKARVPLHNVQVTCPRCKQGFPLSLEKSIAPEPPPQPAPSVQVPPPPQPTPEPFRNPSITELPLEQGGEGAKKLLLLFVLLIVVLVGVRLWADGKKRSVQFPNFIATSEREVAVTWGEEIYFLDHSGKVLRKHHLSPDIIPTQIKFVGDELWVADYAGKTIKRLRNNSLETVVDGNGRFRGTFKFAADLQSGQIFVTDASNHQVHLFTADGKYQSSFGSEGKNPGQFKFPNTVVFDQDGNLLIANTNAFRLDLFSRQGQFLKTAANVQAIESYRFPTLLTQVGDRLAFLHTIDLRQAKVVMYDTEGKFLGELAAPKPIEESGDIAAAGDTILVSDNKERKVYRFSGETLSYLGPFSSELDALGDKANKQASQYAALANGSLILLLAACIPVFYLYLQVRRREVKQLDATDHTVLIPPAAIHGARTDRTKLILAIAAWTISLVCLPAAGFFLKKNQLGILFLALGNLLFVFAALRFFMESGYANPARFEAVERLAKAVQAKLSAVLTPDETVTLCTGLQRNPYLKQPSLVLLTNRRILIFDYSALSPTGCSQFGYGDIAAIALEQVRLTTGWMSRLMKTETFRLTLTLKGTGKNISVQFSGLERRILETMLERMEEKRTSGEALGYAMLCDTCCRPMGPDGCPSCRQEAKGSWKPLALSLLYPGLGQFYNREIKKGSVFCVSFTFGVVLLTQPVITIMNRSAEFTGRDLGRVVQAIFVMLVIYIVSIADANQVGRKGRQLFNLDQMRTKLRK